MITPVVSDSAVMLDWPLPQVGRITLDRAAELNTLTYEMLDCLAQSLDSAHELGARVVVITGSGSTFCCGAYVKYFTDPTSPLHKDPIAIRDDYVRKVIATFRKLQDMPFATIAAINGYALGGGCELALSCDFRLMSANARIGLTEVRLGAVPAGGGLQLLPKLVGRAKALEIILLGDQWFAEEALSVGLVGAVHPADALATAALALARRLLACSPVSVAESKRAISRCEAADPREADEIALDAVASVAAGPDWRDGMTAFSERRAPNFAVSKRARGDGTG